MCKTQISCSTVQALLGVLITFSDSSSTWGCFSNLVQEVVMTSIRTLLILRSSSVVNILIKRTSGCMQISRTYNSTTGPCRYQKLKTKIQEICTWEMNRWRLKNYTESYRWLTALESKINWLFQSIWTGIQGGVGVLFDIHLLIDFKMWSKTLKFGNTVYQLLFRNPNRETQLSGATVFAEVVSWMGNILFKIGKRQFLAYFS